MKRLDYFCDSVAIVGTIAQTEQVFKLISLIITSISVIVSLAYTLYKWFHKAKEDGVITKEEITEALNEIKKSTNDIINKVDEYKEETKEGE